MTSINRRFSIITEPEAESLLDTRVSELKRLQEIESLTSQMSTLLGELSGQVENMKAGSESVAEVTANWIQIVRAVSLAANSMMVYSNDDFKTGSPTTERLVRCAVDELGTIVDSNQKPTDN